MKKPKRPYRFGIIFLLLTVPPIGATQLGWYLHDKQTGFDYGMIVGTVSVIYAAYLMYEKKWREEDEDELMEKLIFFGLAIPILAYVLYLGGTAIMKGFSAKEANRVEKEESEGQTNLETTGQSINLSEELSKLNDLKEKGIISQEDFEKAKNKLLNN
jgi:uncharacterized membrane protein